MRKHRGTMSLNKDILFTSFRYKPVPEKYQGITKKQLEQSGYQLKTVDYREEYNSGAIPIRAGDLNLFAFKKERKYAKKMFSPIEKYLVRNGIAEKFKAEQLAEVFNKLLKVQNLSRLIDSKLNIPESQTDEIDITTEAKNKQKLTDIYPLTLEKSHYSKFFSDVICHFIYKNAGLWYYGWRIEKSKFASMTAELIKIKKNIESALNSINKQVLSRKEKQAYTGQQWIDYVNNCRDNVDDKLRDIKKQQNKWIAQYKEFRDEIWGCPANILGQMFMFDLCRNKDDLEVMFKFVEKYLDVFGFVENQLPDKYRTIEPNELKYAFFLYVLYDVIFRRAKKHYMMRDKKYLKYWDFILKDERLADNIDERKIKQLVVKKTIELTAITTEKNFIELLKQENKCIKIIRGIVGGHKDPIGLLESKQGIMNFINEIPMMLTLENVSKKEHIEERRYEFYRKLYDDLS